MTNSNIAKDLSKLLKDTDKLIQNIAKDVEAVKKIGSKFKELIEKRGGGDEEEKSD